ncbi:MAG: SNF2-related protein [bacterium]
MITDYHAKLFAHELLRRCPSDSVERFAATLMDSQVDLNPHQVDAALFAFRSPLSKGAILADEVGLGKTIEAGIVLSQKWAEGKRKILVILPSSLRKQWHQELQEKFYLPSQILEARTFNKAIEDGKRNSLGINPSGSSSSGGSPAGSNPTGSTPCGSSLFGINPFGINPFDIPEIVICSYYFARNKAEYVQAVNWDLVVIDEAHRLRNVYKSGNKIAQALKQALKHVPKLLLTATPLQNSLLELYGLVSFIDEHAFGDLKSFRTQFARLTSDSSFDDLKQRLKLVCKRTLRRQVLEYIQFTERKAHTQEFIPSDEEETLYDMVSEYLRRPNLQALPVSQRTLMTLVLRKLLASSTFAIAGALDALANKLERRRRDLTREGHDTIINGGSTNINEDHNGGHTNKGHKRTHAAGQEELDNTLAEDFEAYGELADEYEDDREMAGREADECEMGDCPINGSQMDNCQIDDRRISDCRISDCEINGSEINGREDEYASLEEERDVIQAEIEELRIFCDLAMKITQNAKGGALLQALEIGFRMARELGGAEKTIIFTESRRTQNYLLRLLSENGYSDDDIVLFNGSNSDAKSREIYAAWKTRFEGTDKATGSRTADTRAALVEYFRETAKIMIATEAAAEGINLQFCSLVVNYDLPWNPQRIEQRIGRCHRYGQKHDVVVVNFLNKNNAADQRVYELLSEKFRLFSGVFGASDEVLGSIESGVDFEKRIAEIYQTCRTTEEIQASFDALQEELSTQVNENMCTTRQKLLENFDAEVAEKLNVYKAETQASLNRYKALLWDTTRHMLDGRASFNEKTLTFTLKQSPQRNIPVGLYMLKLKPQNGLGYHYRLQHPLAQWVIESAQAKVLPDAELVFDYSAYRASGKKISAINPLIGQSGVLIAKCLTVKAPEPEDYLIMAAITDAGKELEADQARRLFNLPCSNISCHSLPNFLAEDTPGSRNNRLSRLSFDGGIRTGDGTGVNTGVGVSAIYRRMKDKVLGDISQRNALFFEEEMDKLNRWAEDKRKSLKTSLKDYDDQIADLKKQARIAPNLPDKLEIQKKIRTLDKKRDDAWREYDEAAREIERQKDTLIDHVETRLQQEIEGTELFTIRWRLT